jgi:hypothetical protein
MDQRMRRQSDTLVIVQQGASDSVKTYVFRFLFKGHVRRERRNSVQRGAIYWP